MEEDEEEEEGETGRRMELAAASSQA